MIKVLLIAQSAALLDRIRETKEDQTEFSFRTAPSVVDVGAAHEDVQLAIIHVGAGEDVSGFIKKSSCPTIVLADTYECEQATSFFRAGAVDYLTLPLDFAKLTFLLDVLTLRFRTARPSVPLPPQNVLERTVPSYVVAPELAELIEQIRRVAPQDVTVLITGETGTGKTRLARLIHEMSPRQHEPFTIVDCATLNGSLIESEMFGHVKGAFTGADGERHGKLAAAGCGTLLLDEINALPLALQGKLLRAVDERVFEPVGSNRSVPLKARIIAASNVSLQQEVSAGRFRADLFFRLNVAGFYLPCLRDRSTSVAPLCNRFLAEFVTRNRPDITGMAPEVFRALQEYSWPGNIRELRNVIERAVALAPGPLIELKDIPEAIAGPAAGAADATLREAREETELREIQAALQRHGNNRLRAAEELGISRMGLYKKLQKYGLHDAKLG